MERYFEKLPLIQYSNTVCRDFSRRVIIQTTGAEQSPYNYYPYTISHELRADHVAEYYYNDSELDWLIYLQNTIVDPYYHWPLSNYDFERYLVNKYQSIEKAQRKIYLYRNNWYNDSETLTVSYYNNNLANSWKQYYEPVWGIGQRILHYRRKQWDLEKNTNMYVNYVINANNGSSSFVVGDLVDIKQTGTESGLANGEIVYANSTALTVKHVTGNTTANSTFVVDLIRWNDPTANMSSNNSTITFENITTDEAVFWSPVTYYDYEVELNEQRKNIDLVDIDQAPLIIRTVEQLAQQDVDVLTGFSIDITDE